MVSNFVSRSRCDHLKGRYLQAPVKMAFSPMPEGALGFQ